MSVNSDALAVDLRVRRLTNRLWLYLRAAGPFLLGLLLLKFIGGAGLASTVHLPGVHQTTIVRAILSSNILVLKDARGLPLWLFLTLGLSRGMIGDPLNYYFAQRSAKFVKKEARGHFGRFVARGVEQLEHSPHWVILSVVGAMTFATAWVPIPVIPFNPYWVAGAARVKLRWVLSVDLAARLIFLILLFHYGTPLHMAEKAV